MNANRTTGMTIGVLFITGTVSGMLSVALTGTANNTHDYLTKIASDDFQFTLGALFVLLMGFSLAFIPIILYPILKKQNGTLALGYVIFRGALETIVYVAICASMLLLVYVSKDYVAQGDGDFQKVESVVGLILKLRELCTISTIFIFGIGALLFYSALYQSKLVPRWLSAWGIVSITLHLLTGLLIIFELQTESSASNSLMNAPIFLQEMIMAVWLIVKGFNMD